MKLAVFHTGTIRSSWSVLAVPETLRKMGHEVIDAPIPTNYDGAVLNNLSPADIQYYRSKLPSIEQLQSCDLILCYCLEFYLAWVKYFYGNDWLDLRNRVAIYAESSDKAPYKDMGLFSNVQFYPDQRDVEKFDGQFSVPPVDTSVFKRLVGDKVYDVAFLGTMYPSRMQFLESLAPYLKRTVTCGEVTVHDLGGECHYIWAMLNAQNINKMKIHLGLPSMNSTMTTARALETMACGTFLLTYPTSDTLFQDGVHCKFYNPNDPKGLAEMIEYYLANELEREKIALQGMLYVQENHSMEKILNNMLDKLLKPKVMSLSELTVTP